jgi:hypothetical protein
MRTTKRDDRSDLRTISVFTIGLSDDMTHADPASGMRHAGVFTVGEIDTLLTILSDAHVGCDGQHPRILIQGQDSDHQLLLKEGRLLYIDSAEQQAGDVALTPHEICQRIREGTGRPRDRQPSVASTRPRRHATGLTLGVLVASLLAVQAALIASGYYSLLDPLDYAPITNPARLASLEDTYTGAFSTPEWGRRTILVIGKNREARLFAADNELYPDRSVLVETLEYEFADMDGSQVLVFDRSEVVTLAPDGTIGFGDDVLHPTTFNEPQAPRQAVRSK